MRKYVFGLGLIAGPILFLVQALLTPAMSTDTAEYLATAADANTAGLAAVGVFSMLGLVAALLCLRRLAGESTLALLGGGLALAGLVIQPIWIGIEAGTAAIGGAGTGAEQVALAETLNDSTAAMLAMFGAMAYVVGGLLLGAALLRSKAIAAPFAALIGVYPLLMVAGFATSMNMLLIAGGVAATLGMVPVGLKMLSGGEQPAVAAATAAG